MQIGIFSVGENYTDPFTRVAPSECERIHTMVNAAVHADQAELDVFAIGEHHNPPYVTSAPCTLLAYIAARTSSMILSTATTLITTNDPVRVAEEFATLQHLTHGRVDLMLGRGNTPAVYPWFGKDIEQSEELGIENHALLTKLWRESEIDWRGVFRSGLSRFTSVPRPLSGAPPLIWHGAVRNPRVADLAAQFGDAFFANNLFGPMEHFGRLVERYREKFASFGHGRPEDAIVGVGGQVFVKPRSQDALCEFRPYFANSRIYQGAGALEDVMAHTALTVGSPQQVIDKIMKFKKHFGNYKRLLLNIDMGGLSLEAIREQIDLIASHVAPVLRREMGENWPETRPKQPA